MKNARVTPIFPEEGKDRWLHIYFLTLTSEDIADISAALVAEFPRMVFRVSLWDAYGDRMYPNPPEPVAAEARRVSRLPLEWRDPKYRFASHLTDYPEQYGMYGLLAPEGWTPIWKEAADGRYNIDNHPRYTFSLDRSAYFSTAVGRAYMQPRAPSGPNDSIQLRDGSFQSRYNTADPAHGKFARRCKRIFFKYTTNRFARVDRETGHVRFRNDGGEFRVGFHALKWAAAHPRQFAGEDMKPYDWQPPGESAKP